MSKTIKRICCIIGMSVSVLTSAHADVFEDTFRDFTSCDASIFQTLNREAKAWESVAALERLENYSWIKVRNRYEDADNHTDFTDPPTVAGLKLLSYFDETSDLDNMGLYYYWGFMVSGNVEDVLQKLKPLIHSNERLRRDGAMYARTEIKVPGSRWLPFATSSNTPAGLRKIERVFLIEPHETRKDVVRVSCSLQGGVTADVLKELRPDIAPKDYPKQVTATLFDDMQVPESVAKVARESTLTPRFKKLSYTFKSIKTDSSKTENSVAVEMEAQDGFVRVREIYSPFFNVQRLMVAGLVQLKSRMNGIGDGRGSLTTDLKLSVPSMFSNGAKISVHEIMKMQPPRAGEKEDQVSIFCDTTEEFDAKKIFPTLTGRAFKLSCTSEKKNDITTKVFLEDLGISVNLNSKSEYGDWTYQFTQFTVER